jgi:hypothetical protein
LAFVAVMNISSNLLNLILEDAAPLRKAQLSMA